MATLFQLPKATPVVAGESLAGAKAYFYQAGTTTPITTYTTAALSVAHNHPVVADSNGVFAPIFINEAVNATYRLQLYNSADVLQYDVDNLSAFPVVILLSAGSVSAPSLSFSSDTNTGIYLVSADVLGFAVGGSEVLRINSTEFLPQGAIRPPVGSASAPSHSFSTDTNTGFYLSSADQLFFAEGGTGYRVGFRKLPLSATVSGTLTAAELGFCLAITSAVTIDNNVHAAGDEIHIYNNSAGNLTITQGSGVTMRLAGTATTGSRTLAQRGMARLWFVTASEVVVDGTGVT